MSYRQEMEETGWVDEGGCPECGGRVQSNEWDGYCYSCAMHPETQSETLRYARTRAGLMGECLVDYLTKPERFGWTVEALYEMGREAGHNGRLALSQQKAEDAKQVA